MLTKFIYFLSTCFAITSALAADGLAPKTPFDQANDKNLRFYHVTDSFDPSRGASMVVSEGRGFFLDESCTDLYTGLGFFLVEAIPQITNDDPIYRAANPKVQPRISCKADNPDPTLFVQKVEPDYNYFIRFKSHRDYLFQPGCKSLLQAMNRPIEKARPIVDPEDLVSDPENIQALNCYRGIPASPNPKTFQEWCEASQKQKASSEDQLTVTVLLGIAGTQECDAAERALTAISESPTGLDIQSKGISSLAPVASLRGIVKLNASNNQIVHLPYLEELRSLKELDLSQNQISELYPLRQLKSLEILKLNKNNISNIQALKSIQTLEDLDLKNNRITDISPLQSLSNLETLDFSFNHVEAIKPLTQLSHLKTVRAKENPIVRPERLDQSSFEELCFLKGELSETEQRTVVAILGSVNAQNCNQGYPFIATLEKLDLSPNRFLNDLRPVGALGGLKELNLSGMNLKTEQLQPLKRLSQLTTLDLSHNQLKDVTLLESLPSLKNLYLNDNQLPSLNAIKSLAKRLEILALAGNPVDRETHKLLSVGTNFACSTNLDQKPNCWKTRPPRHLRFLEIAPGENGACGILAEDHSVYCWSDQPELPEYQVPPNTRAISIGVGKDTTCVALAEDDGFGDHNVGEVKCWGRRIYDRSPILDGIPRGLLAKKVAVGVDQACAITQDNMVICWGVPKERGDYWSQTSGAMNLYAGRKYGTLCALWDRKSYSGNNYSVVKYWSTSKAPMDLLPQYPDDEYSSRGIQDVDVGQGGLDCLLKYGELVCRDWQNKPATYPGLPSNLRATSISGNSFSFCWSTDKDQGRCIGEALKQMPTDLSGVQKIDVIGRGACAHLKDASVLCWGRLSETSEIPSQTSQIFSLENSGINFQALSAGNKMVCGSNSSQQLQCLGEGGLMSTAPLESLKVLQTAGYENNFCAIQSSDQKDEGEAVCWGTLVDLGGSKLPGKFKLLSVGKKHVCGITSGQEVRCTGTDAVADPVYSFHGQLASWVSTGSNTCIISAKQGQVGKVFCSRPNSWPEKNLVPPDLENPLPEKRAVTLSSSNRQTCALLADNTIRCWANESKSTPLWIPSQIRAVALQAGPMGVCALLVDGGVQCWNEGGLNSVPTGTKWR